MWSSSRTTKLSLSRSGLESTPPCARSTTQRSSNESPVYAFGSAITTTSAGRRDVGKPASVQDQEARYQTRSISSPASRRARSSTESSPVVTISGCGRPHEPHQRR